MKKILRFLDYVATHSDAILTFSASSMVLNVHSNALYLCKPKAKSRVRGYFFLSSNTKNHVDNEAVLNIAKILKNVMSSATETVIGPCF